MSNKQSPLEKEKSMERCAFCGNRMCSTLIGSEGCEPNGHQQLYSRQEAKALLEDWGFKVGKNYIKQ